MHPRRFPLDSCTPTYRRTLILVVSAKHAILSHPRLTVIPLSQQLDQFRTTKISTVVSSKFDSICELQPEFRP